MSTRMKNKRLSRELKRAEAQLRPNLKHRPVPGVQMQKRAIGSSKERRLRRLDKIELYLKG